MPVTLTSDDHIPRFVWPIGFSLVPRQSLGTTTRSRCAQHLSGGPVQSRRMRNLEEFNLGFCESLRVVSRHGCAPCALLRSHAEAQRSQRKRFLNSAVSAPLRDSHLVAALPPWELSRNRFPIRATAQVARSTFGADQRQKVQNKQPLVALTENVKAWETPRKKLAATQTGTPQPKMPAPD